MARYEAEASKFKDDMRKAGFAGAWVIRSPLVNDMAKAIDRSPSHIRNMMYGHNRAGPEVQSRIDALIAAKANGPVGFTPADPDPPEYVEQVEVDMAAPQPMPRRTKYQVIKVFDGYAVVENPIAVFRGLSWAEEYAHWLNDQINRGKEGG